MDINNMTLDDINSIESNFSKDFDNSWNITILKDDFKDINSKYVVAKNNDEIIGFAGIKIVLDEAEIMNIVVKTNKRNLGIGSKLLEKLEELAKENMCKCIHLEVNENNFSAIHLYEKYGFKRIGLRKKYYNNTYDAILMKKYI